MQPKRRSLIPALRRLTNAAIGRVSSVFDSIQVA
jgi:hypothetical protein